MKIAYIGIDLFYPALEAFVSNGCEVLKIFSCKTDNVTEFNTKITGYAKEHGIPYTLDRIRKKDIEELIHAGAEAIVCAGYYYLIPITEEIPMINIHPTLLPVGRGSWPMPVIIMERHPKSGVTIHKMEESFDTGDIILQREFILEEKETHRSYMDKVCKLLSPMIKELVGDFYRLYQQAVPQKGGTYIEAPEEQTYTITEDMTVEEADLILRAFYGYECFYKKRDEVRVVINGRAVKEENTESSFYELKDGYIEVVG